MRDTARGKWKSRTSDEWLNSFKLGLFNLGNMKGGAGTDSRSLKESEVSSL